MARETLLAQTFVELADTLVDEFDVVDLLTLLTDRCVEVLDITAAGLMLVAPDFTLRAVASSSDTLRIVELSELQSQEGPCWDAFQTGEPVRNGDLAADPGGWANFATFAVNAGFRAVEALPMRLRGQVIGALNVFNAEPGELSSDDRSVAQALADVATIAILQERAAREARSLTDQLQRALTNRVAIEQAKGIVAERMGLDMEQAFARIRRYARDRRRLLADVATDLVAGRLRDLHD